MFQILDIGNTHARIAIWENGAFSSVRMINTSDLDCSFFDGTPAVAACVCAEVKKRLEKCNIDFISARNQKSDVDFSPVDTSSLGADRVANAVALAEYYPLPGVVIDCGTAITMEIVDEKKRFVGGAIAPGRALMRASLARGTSLLPDSSLLTAVPEEPGRNTIDAIGFGVGNGALGVVRELVDAARRHWNIKTLILAGGDAEFFRRALPDALLPGMEFTLHGVRLAAGIR